MYLKMEKCCRTHYRPIKPQLSGKMAENHLHVIYCFRDFKYPRVGGAGLQYFRFCLSSLSSVLPGSQLSGLAVSLSPI